MKFAVFFNVPVQLAKSIALIFLFCTIIALVIFPVSVVLLDFLIATNLVFPIFFSIIVVFSCFIRPVRLFAFLFLLFVTTFITVVVGIASARDILLHANAGKIIQTFGGFVVGGNFIVGSVVFLILTVVQLIVVVKVAKKISRVFAEFNLHVIPAQQMSIDTKLKDGVINADVACQKKLALSRNRQFYAAVSNGMNFVKWLFIIGIVMAIINFGGGLIVGVTQHNMTLVDAARTYCLLSIGGGLVLQIPLCFIALAAIIITVVSSCNDSRPI